MGFLSILNQIKQLQNELRILTIGLDNSGKTTTIKSLLKQDLQEIEPTLGFSIFSTKIQNYQLNIWDVGGQKTIRAYWKNYYEATDALIWVVDSADRRRLQLCKQALQEVLKAERLQGAPLLILANKQDVDGALSPDEIQKMFRDFENRQFRVFGCSALQRVGIDEAFDWLLQAVSDRKEVDVADDLELIY
ncbi:ADP-Ribosylation_Factor like protein 2b [Hexamita inflata]|uniref:ADP-Ribosylation Factor like protein 2b n=1 Tax=Hexamita inflata TaxID=28002 RepID=A0AA86TJX9_9EUKA|nr:ADP-Ribosylation Factor like protein 2b [Hexamita inflata]